MFSHFASIAVFAVPVIYAHYLDSLSDHQHALFDYAINGLDLNFAPPFLFNSPRYSAWYAVGLLARAEHNDVSTANAIIRDVISYQYTDPASLWFGTFKDQISAPDPGPVYPPQSYVSYDMNIALFITTSFIIALEEFHHLLDPSLVDLIKHSMYNATIGDGYRVGGLNGDNLYPIYSNPWYMRVMSATYVGHIMNDANMSFWGDQWARQAIDEFEKFNTLSEFNSGTYTGVTLYALSLWGYMPKNSTIATHAPSIITKTWHAIANLYNPTLLTLGGPWDRTYGFSLKSYFGILGAQITGLIGGIASRTAPIPFPLVGSEHYQDAAIIALTPLISKFHDPHVPTSLLPSLQQLSSPHLSTFQAASPPFDNPAFPRNYTSWAQSGLSAGAISFDSNVVGGAAVNPVAFTPAVILWDAGSGTTGWISLYPTTRTMHAVASGTNLTISYPSSLAFPSLPSSPSKNTMTFLISGLPRVTLPPSFPFPSSSNAGDDPSVLPGLKLHLSGNVVEHPDTQRSFVYGQGTINDLPYYNLTYIIPDLLLETAAMVPELVVSYEKI